MKENEASASPSPWAPGLRTSATRNVMLKEKGYFDVGKVGVTAEHCANVIARCVTLRNPKPRYV